MLQNLIPASNVSSPSATPTNGTLFSKSSYFKRKGSAETIEMTSVQNSKVSDSLLKNSRRAEASPVDIFHSAPSSPDKLSLFQAKSDGFFITNMASGIDRNSYGLNSDSLLSLCQIETPQKHSDFESLATLQETNFFELKRSLKLNAKTEKSLENRSDVDYSDDETSTENTSFSSEANNYAFAWSLATQKGYRYYDEFSRTNRTDIHIEMEDKHYPSTNDTPTHFHAISGRPFQIFMLADGHGGHKCAEEAVKILPVSILKVINEKVWDFSSISDQNEISAKIQHQFLEFDKDYCSRKLGEFRRWLEKAQKEKGNPFEAKYKKEKPSDDGCTLVINLLYDGYLINANVGDSRTVLMKQGLNQEFQTWDPKFASIDHTPCHQHKATQIHTNGGRFIFNGETAYVADLFEADNFKTYDVQDETQDRTSNLVSFLSRCRIGRPLGWRIEELNYPSCTTLNLTGTAGDLFFKYEPPLITAKPDVSFVKLELQKEKYIMVMASDGVWDHMDAQKPNLQHKAICDFITSSLIDSNSEIQHEQDSSEKVQDKLDRLGKLAHAIADREMNSSPANNLYAKGFVRYDDVTVFVVLVEGFQNK